MSLPFSKEPLKEFLTKTSKKKENPKKEYTVLLIILAVFILGSLMVLNPKLTGMVTYGTNAERLVIQEQFFENSSLAFGLKGNVTSVRISGNILGEGTAKIYIDDKLILDSSKIKKSSDQITGFVVFENQSIIEVPEEEQEEIVPQVELPVIEETQEVINENIELPEIEYVETIEQENTEEENTEVIDLITNESVSLSENITIQNPENEISEELAIIENDSSLPINETLINVTLRNITLLNATLILNTSLILENGTINLTDTVNETYNQTIETGSVEFENISSNQNETEFPIVEIKSNITDNKSNSGNISTLPDYPINESIQLEGVNSTNISSTNESVIIISGSTFENYCLETCYLKNIGKNIILRIEVDNAILNLTELTYTYIEESNISINETIANTTVNNSLIEKATLSLNYSNVEINKPVMWKKVVNASLINKTILPKDAYNITSEENVKVKIGEVEYELEEYNGFAYSRALENEVKRLKKPTKEDKSLETYDKVTSLNKKIISLNAQDIETETNITLEFASSLNEVEISYYTEGPSVNEDIINSYKKKITISSEVHYENVLTYTDIKESSKGSINVYWIINGTRNEFNELEYIDTNNNSLIDKLQWITPHLSNQTFEISITVLNPYEYLRDGDTWIVAFNTTGIGNLTISSPNANWTEFLTDDILTKGEMSFQNLSCGELSLINNLKIIDYENNYYNYADLALTDSILIRKLLIEDYECNSTGYLTNYMNIAGYATLLFEFSNQNMTVSDYAYDPISSYTIAADSDDGHEYPQNTWNEFSSWFGHYTDPSSSDEWMVARFRRIEIPKGANIHNAVLRLTAAGGEGGSYTVYSKVKAQSANSGAVPGSANLPSTWSLTSSGTDFDISYPGGWVTGQNYSVSVTDIVQEIINRQGWSVNNNISFVIINDGTAGDSDLEVYDYGTYAPRLYINYTVGTNAWWSSSWGYRRKITLSNSEQNEDLINFTVLVPLNRTNFNYSLAKPFGADLRFIDADGATVLKHELEYWNASGKSFLWVKVPNITKSSNLDYIWLYYNNSAASDGQNKTGTWDQYYEGVWHLNGSIGQRQDSTSNANHLNNKSTLHYTNPGKVAGSIDVDDDEANPGLINRSDSNLASGFPSKNGETTNSFSVSFWVKPEAFGWNDWLGKNRGGNGGFGFYDENDRMTFYYRNGATDYSITSDASSILADTWHFVSVVHDSTNDIDYIYVDGKETSTTGRTSDPTGTTASFMIGGTDSWPGDSDGVMDEVRVSKTARTGDWINASYKSMNRRFISLGNEQEINDSYSHPFNVKILNFSNTATNKVYMRSNATNQVSNISIGDFTTATNPTGSEGWGAYEVKVAGYNALKNDDASYLNISARGAAGINREPFARFNFSTNASPSLVNWIYVAMDQRRIQASGNGENCYYWIYNYTKADWMEIVDNTSSTSDVLRTYNYTSGVLDLMNLSRQIVLMSSGVSMDANEGCLVDFVEVRIGYYNNSVPVQSTPIITPSSPNVSSTLTCGWNSILDSNGDTLKNITNWYKNNKSFTNLYMPFEGNGLESKVAFDYSGNGNKGRLSSNGPTWNRTGGKVGGAYRFDGSNDIIEIPAKSYFDRPPFTVMGWFYSTTTSASKGESMYMLNKRGNSQDLWHLRITSTSNNLEFRYYNATNYLNGPGTPYSIAINKWYHFAVTIDTDYTVRLYVNGSYVDSYNSGPFNTSSGALRIGGASTSTSRFNGTIDEIKHYNATLSPDQIYLEYIAGANGNNNKKLSYQELIGGDQWYCSVVPNDGYNDGIRKNSSRVTVAANNPPVWINNPIVSPRIPIDSSNLTCLYNLTDERYDYGVNITNWYKNGKSITLLYLPFETNGGNEDSITADYSGYGNNATVYGAEWNNTNGKIGGGYHFDKGIGEYLSIPDSPILRGMSELTIETWVYPITKANWAIILQKGDTAVGWRDIAYALETDGSADQKVYFYLNTTTQAAEIYSNAALPKNQWTHIAARYDGTKINMFINGVKQTEVSYLSGDVLDIANPIMIGVDAYVSWSDYWNGSIDEVRMYNESLSDEQIYLNYIRTYSNKTIQVSSSDTTLWDEWFCRVTPTDGSQYGETKNSSISTITLNGNYRPTAPTSLLCDGGLCNYTTSGTINLNCTGSFDNESNAITYVVEKGSLTDGEIFFEDVESISWSDWNASYGTYSDVATDNPKVIWQNSTYGGNGYYKSATRAFWIDNEDDIYTGYLTSPNITIPDITENLTLNFWIRVNMENGWDGCWAEYKIGDNNWATIDDSMIVGTTSDYSGVCDGPSAGHACWEGNLGLFKVNVTLPEEADGNPISFRWIAEADNSGTAGGTDGCWVDDINVSADVAYSFTVIGNHSAGSSYSWNTGLDTPGEVYEKMRCSAIDVTGSTANSEYYTLDTNLTMGGNEAPTINTPTFLPSTVNTSSNIQCYATPDDTESSTLTVEWFWYNSTTLELGGNTSGLTAGSPALITTLGRGNTTRGEVWNCTVRTYDGSSYSEFSSALKTIQSLAPTHDTPSITPVTPTATNDLTCNWNNADDIDNDMVLNITNWYKNNISITVLHMPFEGNGNEDKNATDYSGYDNNGTVFEAIWSSTGGRVGGRYEFDGTNDYIEIPADSTLNLPGDFTLEAWVYPHDFLGTASIDQRILINRIDANNAYQLTLTDPASDDSEAYGFAFSVNEGGTQYIIGTDNINSGYLPNTWYHVVGTYTASSHAVNLYVNGVLREDEDLYDFGLGTSGNLQIGRRTDGGYFDGLIDEIKIYNHSLSAAQVNQAYTAGVNGKINRIIKDDELVGNEQYICVVTPNDGYWDGITKSSSAVTITPNTAPTQNTPTVTPTYPNMTTNITCNWNNITDAEDNNVLNITNWYKNNNSITVLYMPFEGNDNEEYNATDYSGYENNGTVFNAIWNRTGGKIGGDYYFDGDSSYIEIPDDRTLRGMSELTVEAWVYTGTNFSYYPRILEKGAAGAGDTNISYALRIESGTQRLQFDLTTDSGGANTYSNSGLPFNQWNHIVGRYDGTETRVFVNGVRQSDNNAFTGKVLNVSGTPLHIGVDAHTSWGDYWNGSIDEVKIYNIALSDQQIYANYVAGSNNKTPRVIVSEDLDSSQHWYCSVTPNDGYIDGTTKNSTYVRINSVPTHNTPTITPSSPNISSNLTCSWNSVSDINHDTVINITNWYKNNKSITLLYLPFEGNGNEENNVTDYSGHEHNGTVILADWNRTGGKVGGAYRFYSTDSNYISIEDDGKLGGMNQLTIETWVYANTKGDWDRIIEKGNTVLNRERAFVLETDSTADQKIYFDLNTTTDFGQIYSDSALPKHEWVHLVVRYDGHILKMFVNGIEQADTEIITGKVLNLQNPIHIGSGAYYTSNSWNGSIDEVRFYNHSLSPQQIRANYQAGLVGKSLKKIVSNELGADEEWLCSVTPNDGYEEAVTKNSTSIYLDNSAPTQSTPTITPTSPITTSNLTCNWQSVTDTEGEKVYNITSWLKNNRSVMLVYLPFEGGSNSTYTKDYSGLNNNGNVSSAIFGRSIGKIGGGYEFDGNDDIIDIGSDYDATESITVMTWIKPQRRQKDNAKIVTQRNSADDSYVFALQYDSTEVVFFQAHDSPVSTTTFNVTNSSWYHLAGTYDGRVTRLFVNGVLIDSDLVSPVYSTSTNPITIGARISGGTIDHEFNGTIDEVKIYNYSLTSTEVYDEYIAGFNNKTYRKLSAERTAGNEKWACLVIPNDGYIDGTMKNASVFIQNSPTIPSTLTCNKGSCADSFSDSIVLNCSGSTDFLGDSIVYVIEKGNASSYNATTTLNKQINTGNDDAEEFEPGPYAVDLASSDLEIGLDGNRQLVGMRFQSVNIPQGAEILYANVTMEVDVATWTGKFNVNVLGEDTNSAPAFSASSGNLTNREKTSSEVNWAISQQFTPVNTKYATPNIRDIIQEIVDRPGWSSGNNMAIFIGESNSSNDLYDVREMESYDGESAAAPILYIKYRKYDYTVIGNHTAGTTLTWNLASDPKHETYERLRCRAVDPSGSGLYSDYYRLNTSLWVNRLPTHNTPTITPTYPNATSNLTCNWQSVSDADSDRTMNITNWYKNNKSTTLLYMPFEGNGNEARNATDYSGYENNGTVFGATWNRTGGKVGGGYEFDGNLDNYIIIANSATLGTKNFTIELWFNNKGPGDSTNMGTNSMSMQPFVSKGRGEADGNNKDTNYMFGFLSSGTNLVAGYEEYSTGNNINVTADLNLNQNRWYYAAMRFNGTSLDIFLNGTKVVGLRTTAIPRYDSIQPIGIGTAFNSVSANDGAFNGSIDEVRIYNHSLSDRQIYANFQAGTLSHPPKKIISSDTSLYDSWMCSVTPNDGYGDGITKNSTKVTIDSIPLITTPTLSPSTANTSSNIGCYATATDLESSSLTAYWYWFNSSTLKLSGTTSVTSGVNTLITTLGAGNTTKGERWNCTVKPYDGILFGTNKTARIPINNSIPTQSTPTITPTLPNATSNLTCNWQSVSDADGEKVVNITNWYKNGVSSTVLYMPFEGNGNESRNATDYSGYRNKGTVFGATWNRTGGKVGGGYSFDGTNDNIVISHIPAYNLSQNFSIEMWFKRRELGDTTYLLDSFNGTTFKGYRIRTLSNNALGFEIGNGVTSEQEQAGTFNQAGRWYHVVFVLKMNTDQIDYYFDGTYSTTDTFATVTNIIPDPEFLAIGASDTGASVFNGTIDEVKIYNYTLSAGQIYQNYKAGLNNKTANIITLESTALGEQWKCSVTPNDGYSDGQTKNSTSVIISATNTAPTRVNLSTPTAGNTTVHRRYTRFTWDAAYDLDSDPLNYTLNITSPYCSNLYYGNISSLNFTAQSELCIGNMYFWQVRAYDGTEYGQWSQKWNFTLEPIIVLNLTTNRVNFGNLSNGDIVSTDGNASPLIVQNDGNIRLNISYVSALNSLFSSIGLNTAYFQFKIDNDTTESSSFNWTSSQTSWTNITSITVQNKSAIAHLKYQDSQDTAEIDIKVTVPTTEGAGRKSTIVYIIGESP